MKVKMRMTNVIFSGIVLYLIGSKQCCDSLPESNEDLRIVVGEVAESNEFPWHVSIQQMAHQCSGVALAQRWVLTAASCVVGLAESLTQIRVGSNWHNRNGVLVNVERIVSHPHFDRRVMTSNIALIKTTVDMFPDLQANHPMIELASEPIHSGTELVVSGWGIAYQTSGVLSAQLRKVTMQVIHPVDCVAAYERFTLPVSAWADGFCAGHLPNGGESLCHGDFGGPAVYRQVKDQQEGSILFGIGSFAGSCGRPGSPSVFTRVAEYRDWITQVMTDGLLV